MSIYWLTHIIVFALGILIGITYSKYLIKFKDTKVKEDPWR